MSIMIYVKTMKARHKLYQRLFRQTFFYIKPHSLIHLTLAHCALSLVPQYSWHYVTLVLHYSVVREMARYTIYLVMVFVLFYTIMYVSCLEGDKGAKVNRFILSDFSYVIFSHIYYKTKIIRIKQGRFFTNRYFVVQIQRTKTIFLIMTLHFGFALWLLVWFS